jgi:hypothetical protein
MPMLRNRSLKCIFRIFPFVETSPPSHEVKDWCEGSTVGEEPLH